MIKTESERQIYINRMKLYGEVMKERFGLPDELEREMSRATPKKSGLVVERN